MSPLVNLNSTGSPQSRISEAELLQLIASRADGDTDFAGLGDFSDGFCNTMPIPSLNKVVYFTGASQPVGNDNGDRRFWPITDQPPAPAEACTDLGADSPAREPARRRHGLVSLFDSYPRIAALALACFILMCLGAASVGDLDAAADTGDAIEALLP